MPPSADGGLRAVRRRRHPGADASRRWASALGMLGAGTAGAIGLRVATQARELGVVDVVETAAVGLAVALFAVAISLRRAADRAPERFDAAPLATRGAFLRVVAAALVIVYLAVAFSRVSGIVGRLVVYEMAVLLVAALVLRAAPKIDAPLQRLGGVPGVGAIDLVVFNGLVAVLLLEGGLRVWLTVHAPPPWLSFGPNAFTYKLEPSRDPERPPNPQGYMDLPFTAEKVPGVRRVVVVGDSFCAGHVSYQENWLTVADELIGESAEIYNLGIHNTSPLEYLEVLQREGLSYRPDLVVGSFYVGNDVDFGYVDPHPLYKESLRIYHVAMRLVELWRESRRKGSTLREAFAREEGTGDVAAAAEVFQFSHEGYVRQQRRHMRLCRRERNADDEREWRFSLDAVARIAKLCQERDIPFVLVVSPDAYQTDPEVLKMALVGLPDDGGGRYPPWSADDFDLDAPERRIAHFAEERAIPLLDLLPAFAAARARGEGPFFLERNNHWNPAGNRVAAQALARFLAPKLAGLAPAGGDAH